MTGERASAASLLLLCGASESAVEKTEELRTVASNVGDWSHFYEIAFRHVVIPLAEQKLAKNASDLVPADIAAQLRTASLAGAIASLKLTGELVAVMSACAASNIDVMPFKGPTLATLVYGNLSLRQYQDLDILVARADVERARTMLFSLGYVPAVSYDDDQRSTLRQTGHHEQLVRADTIVELHWSLNNRTLTHDKFESRWWEDRQAVVVGGMTMQTLGAERLLLYLCMHGGKHSWGRLAWLFDLHFALRTYPTANWDVIWSLARENGAERMVTLGLALVAELLDGHSLVAEPLHDRRVDTEAKRLCELIAKRIRSDEPYEPVLDFKVQLLSRERLRDRLRYTWHVLATPHQSDVRLLKLPRGLNGAYYVLRPLRLLLKSLVRHTSGHS